RRRPVRRLRTGVQPGQDLFRYPAHPAAACARPGPRRRAGLPPTRHSPVPRVPQRRDAGSAGVRAVQRRDVQRSGTRPREEPAVEPGAQERRARGCLGAVPREPHEAVIDIHPSAFIAPGAVVLGDVTLAARVSIWYGAVLRGDTAPIRVGEASNVQDGSIIHVDEGLPATIGARVGVGHRAVLHGCTVEDECLIGMGSILLNDVRIGTGSVVAAGAVDRKSTRLNSSHLVISYAVFCLKKKKTEMMLLPNQYQIFDFHLAFHDVLRLT